MEGNNLNNMNVENNSNNIQPSVVNNQPPVQPVAPAETQTPMAAVETVTPVTPVEPQVPVAPATSDVVTPVQPVQQTPVAPTVEPNAAPFTTTSTPNVDNNMPNNGNKKKKTGLFIVLGLLIVAVIGVVIFFLLTNKDKESNNTENTEKKPEQQENKPETELSWNGVYENENGTIYLYEIDDDELAFSIETDGWPTQGTADIDGNTAEGDIFDTYTFELNGNTIEFTTTDEELIGGTFTKVRDYTKEDYYNDNVGDASYLETGLNGVFEGNGVNITIYQIDADQAELIITKDYSTYQSSVGVVNGAISYQDEFFDDIESISASITGDTLVITASSTDVESLLNEVSGTYTRTKTLTIDDVLNFYR